MKFYFDSNSELNLCNISEIKEIRPLKQLKEFFEVNNAEFAYTTEYQTPGIYLIEVSKLSHQWSGGPFLNSFNTIEHIPAHVIAAAKQKKIRIVILSVVEGNAYVKEYWDGFRALTDSIKLKELPQFSVLVVSANVKADAEYKDWCESNNEVPYIEFIAGSEGPYSLPKKDNRTANMVARDNEAAYAYSSLNRAHRPHRTEHLFVLANKGLLSKGLVSGGTFFNMHGYGEAKYIDVDSNIWNKILSENYPKSIDVNSLELISNNPANTINTDIYNNSLLSVVTETFFEEPGLFITEKTFKPITVGSPQISLSQPYLIEYMKFKFDINLKFPMLDQEYDRITDPVKRFRKFHLALATWCNWPIKIKQKCSIMWDEQLLKNRDIIYNTNFKKIITDDIIKSTQNYFSRL